MNLKKASCALVLGAFLALGLMSASPAAAFSWFCASPAPGRTVNCPNTLVINGATRTNVGVWCSPNPSPAQPDFCYYQ